jgi:spore coat polysaccharide biosynthesis protein SpsF
MKISAIVQARMGSTRLPGKVMKLLCGKTVLAHVLARVKACSLVDEIIVATTLSQVDSAIAVEADNCQVLCFRGSETDVLERYYLAAKEFHADIIVRVTSDCPLFDPQVLKKMLTVFRTMLEAGQKIDYLSNTIKRTYPRGLDAEIFTFEALESTYKTAKKPYEREHVTPFIQQHPDWFALHSYVGERDLSAYRWTLDTEEDWCLIFEIYRSLYTNERLFSTDEVIELLQEKPALSKVNACVKQKGLEE